MCCDSTSPALYDLIGLGFGPSNIAIAGAIVERWSSPNTTQRNDDLSFKSVLFLEKHTSFQWHPGMLLPGAQMQISFMKDLATLRSPQSPITFLNYLHSQNRLPAFINRGSTTPSRKEFADYLGWAAKYVEKQGVAVNYGQQVIAVDEDSDGLILVTSRSVKDGREHVFKTRNLIISPGGSARIPTIIAPLLKEPSVIDRSTVLHSSMYKTCRDKLFQSIISSSPRPLRIAVIGGGQSAAEVAMNLRDCLSSIPAGNGPMGHQVDMIIRKGSLKPSDDTPFSNEVFDPETTETWFGTNQAARDRFKAEYNSTNYSVVNPRTIDQLYEIIYDQKVDGAIAARDLDRSTPSPIINILPNSSIVSISHNSNSNAFSFTILNTSTRELTENRKYDAIVCATGYARTSWVDLLRQSKCLGKRFGVENSPTHPPVRLVPFAPRVSSDADVSEPAISPSSSQVSSGLHSPITPVTSPQPLTPVDGGDSGVNSEVKVYISRKYRLLPLSSAATSGKASDEGLKARIYVQGMEESTHGLSDTLLSVVSVRAGEVVEDLFSED